MSPVEEELIALVEAAPGDPKPRLVYADWLDERGDVRAEFLRARLCLDAIEPDHAQWTAAEQRLGAARGLIDPGWLRRVEPQLEAHDPDRGCCFDQIDGRAPDVTILHRETQDTACDAWTRVVDLIEDAAADDRSELLLDAEMDREDYEQLVTLPASIGKLRSVERLRLYNSNLVRIPPEIGQMASLEHFDPYTSYRLHWFPYEIALCPALMRSRVRVPEVQRVRGALRRPWAASRLDLSVCRVGRPSAARERLLRGLHCGLARAVGGLHQHAAQGRNGHRATTGRPQPLGRQRSAFVVCRLRGLDLGGPVSPTRGPVAPALWAVYHEGVTRLGRRHRDSGTNPCV